MKYNKEHDIERLQTQIEMIRSESRILTHRIERMFEQRKQLSEEKRICKANIQALSELGDRVG